MTSERSTALVVGVLFILTFVTSIAGSVRLRARPERSQLRHRSPAPTRGVFLGAFLELFLIITNIGCAVVLFPILKRQNEGLALGYVAARIVECTFILVGILSVLAVVTLRQDATTADAGSLVHDRHVARRRQELDVPARPRLRRRDRDRADAGLADVPLRPGVTAAWRSSASSAGRCSPLRGSPC